MLLGVYHFNNPGKDSYNTEVDDYWSDKRQKEIKEVVDLLEEFKPTKILVELSPNEQSKIDSLYNLYLKNQIALKIFKVVLMKYIKLVLGLVSS
jgi:hypothetical protein